MRVCKVLAAAIAALILAFGSAYVIAQTASPGTLDPKYTGWWNGVSGSGASHTISKVRTAVVTQEFGHTIDRFEFQVAADGRVTGSGKATYWFNITSDANLIVTRQKTTAYLEGGKQTIDFKIEGQMKPDGKVKLTATPAKELSLINAGTKQTMGAWNVFGPNESSPAADHGDTLRVASSQKFEQINMSVEWEAEKFDCDALKKEIDFVEHKYLPYVDTCIAAYEKARTDPNVWNKLDAKQAQNWVLKEIQKKYPAADVGAQTTAGPDGVPVTQMFPGEEPYPTVLSWREAHEAYHAEKHIPLDDRMYNSLPDQDYVRWALGNEVDTWTNVNKKLAQQRLSLMKQIYQKYCSGQ